MCVGPSLFLSRSLYVRRTFGRIIDGSKSVMVRFDKEYSYGDEHDAWKSFGPGGGDLAGGVVTSGSGRLDWAGSSVGGGGGCGEAPAAAARPETMKRAWHRDYGRVRLDTASAAVVGRSHEARGWGSGRRQMR